MSGLCCVSLLLLSQVRWINVQGLSWDVITTLAVAFDLHPLVRRGVMGWYCVFLGAEGRGLGLGAGRVER